MKRFAAAMVRVIDARAGDRIDRPSPERFTRGDLAAFESIFKEFEGEVYRWIMRIVRDRGAAEELTVETFLADLQGAGAFRSSRAFGAGPAHRTNLALNHLKGRRVEGPLIRDISAGVLDDPAMRRETRDARGPRLPRPPPKLRAVASLALIEQQSYDDIAEALGISAGAVKSRVFRAVRILRIN